MMSHSCSEEVGAWVCEYSKRKWGGAGFLTFGNLSTAYSNAGSRSGNGGPQL